MNDRLMDFIFKILASGTIPVLLWVNSLSVDIAVLKNKIEDAEGRVTELEEEQKRVNKVITENQGSLREVNATVGFIRDMLVDIRNDLRRENHGN